MDDLISRQEAIDALAGWKISPIVLDTVPSEPHWISCSEKLPEESGDYLVTVAHHNGELWVEVDQFDNENGSWWHYMDDVTAWMPLPKPYKGEKT